MAKSRVKAGGCRKGRLRERRIGMNSGKVLLRSRNKKKRGK